MLAPPAAATGAARPGRGAGAARSPHVHACTGGPHGSNSDGTSTISAAAYMRCAAASLNMTSSAAEALPRNSSAAMRLPPARVARFTLQARLAPLQSGGKPGMEGKHLHSWRSCACRTPGGMRQACSRRPACYAIATGLASSLASETDENTHAHGQGARDWARRA